MAFYSLTADPSITYDGRDQLVKDESIVGQYGVDVNDAVMAGVDPPKYAPLDPHKELPNFSCYPSRIQQTTNSINRGEFAVPPLEAQITIVSNRNKLRSIMATFIFAADIYYHKDFSFEVERRGNLIYFGPLDEKPGQQINPQPTPKEYGIPFEDLITESDPNLYAFFRFYSYSLLGVPIIVRSEIDCVNNDSGDYYELKSKKERGDGRDQPDRDQDYMRYIWCQMFLGRANSLVLGVYKELPCKNLAKLKSVTVYPYSQVENLANPDFTCIARFASLLNWIRVNVSDSERKTLSYAKNLCGFTLEVNAPV